VDNNMELRLLHSLVDKNIYNGCMDVVSSNIFSEDTEDIAEAIQELHAEFTEGVDLGVVENHLLSKKVSTTAKKHLLSEIFVRISATEPLPLPIVRKNIFTLAIRKQRLDALNELAVAIEKNADTHEHVISLLEGVPLEEEKDSEIVGTDNAALAEHYSTANRFPFSLENLQHHIGGMARGNLCIVFGRPEMGKSSFVACLVAEYLRRGISVEYYANEEPGRKIMLNIRRAVTGEDDKAISQCIINDTEHEIWNTASKHLKVRQIGEMAIETIISRAKKDKPDVIVLDQVDKLQMNAPQQPNHDRLKALYVKTRELAKTGNCLVINVCQASASADDTDYVPLSAMDGSKTGKPGEADIIFGIGKKDVMQSDLMSKEMGLPCSRFVTVSKNKINGFHSKLQMFFNKETNQWIGKVEGYGNSD
jgi:archaellum biogenesis ATPase FlaH/F0F1-type ATP synthase delta subunit